MWNPVKELKGDDGVHVVQQLAVVWNPVKELKEDYPYPRTFWYRYVESGEGIERGPCRGFTPEGRPRGIR